MPEDQGPSPGYLRVKITSPIHMVADMEAESVCIPALQGSCLILPNRAPLFCLLNMGNVLVRQTDGTEVIYYVSRGVCEVRRDICAIMGWAVRADEINWDDVRERLQTAETYLAAMVAPAARQELSDRIAFYRLLLTKQKG